MGAEAEEGEEKEKAEATGSDFGPNSPFRRRRRRRAGEVAAALVPALKAARRETRPLLVTYTEIFL